MAAPSSATRASTSSRSVPADGSTPDLTDAWAPASATRWPPGLPGRQRRSCCCWVPARPQPQCRYDQVVPALGGAGDLVTAPAEIGPALRRAFAAGVPYLVNVVAHPLRSQ